MNSTTSSPRQIEKVSSDNQVIGFDLFSQLTYMSILARGGVGRDRLLEYCGRQKFVTAVFFEYINLMARSMGVEYTRAFQAVAQKAKAPRIKSLLLRFSASISSGSSESDFVLSETRSEGEHYRNDYERNVENLRKWTDAYAAVLVAVTLIMVVSQVSSLLGSTSESFIYLMLFTLTGVTSVGVYLIYKVAPYERFTYDPVSGATRDRKISRFLALILGPAAFAVGMLLFFVFTSNDISPVRSSSAVFILLGIALLPSGYLASRDATRVNKIDEELPMFLRAIGSIAGSAGVTLTESLRRIDSASYQHLRLPLERLRTRLESGLPSTESWETFNRETGSELAARTTGMFVDGVEVGCDPAQIGEICSDYAQNITELRAKRKLTSSTFSFLTLTMNLVMAFILVFVLEIIINFNSKLNEVVSGESTMVTAEFEAPTGLTAPPGLNIPQTQDLSSGLDVFQMTNMGSLQYTIIFAVAILTIANSLAPKFSEGGNNLRIISYLSSTSLCSGIVLLIVPPITKALLSV